MAFSNQPSYLARTNSYQARTSHIRVLNWQGVPIVLLTKSMKMCYLDGSFLLSVGNTMSPNHVMYMCMVAQFYHWRC